jgi:hypothetical protein
MDFWKFAIIMFLTGFIVVGTTVYFATDECEWKEVDCSPSDRIGDCNITLHCDLIQGSCQKGMTMTKWTRVCT